MEELRRIGKYDVTGTLGEGSFGIVYRGFDPFIKRDLAIKVCTVADKELRRRFYREAEIAGRIQHKNIVTVFAFGTEDERPYLVQELLDGEDLDEVIKRREALPHRERLDILLQVAHGLDYAHRQGVVHRDVKPGNIRRLENGRIKLMDFGIAKLAGAQTQLTREGVTLGTASYLPPEQVRAEPLDHRADIFSFGVLAYELLSYERPFRGNTLSALVYQILYKVPVPLDTVWEACPPTLSELVGRCLAKKPDERWASFGEIVPVLEEVRSRFDGGKDPVPMAPRDKLDDTQPVALADDADEAGKPADTERAASAPPAAASSSAPTSAADGALASDLDDAQTLRLEDAVPDHLLMERAAEIGGLIAKGELDSAMRELEDTVQRHHDAGREEELDLVEPLAPMEPVEASPAPPSPRAPSQAAPAPKPKAASAKAPPPKAPPPKAAPPPKPAPRQAGPRQAGPRQAGPLKTPLPQAAPPQAAPPKAAPPKAAPPKIAPPKAAPPMTAPPKTAPPKAAPPMTAPPKTAPPKTAPGAPAAPAKGRSMPPAVWLAAAAVAAVVLGLLALRGLRGDRPAEPAADVVQPQPVPVAAESDGAAPAPAPTGSLRVVATPWAELVEVIDGNGALVPLPDDPFTPLVLELTPGRYLLTLRHPDAEETAVCEAQVTVAGVVDCTPTLMAADAVAYFKAVGWWQ